MEEKHVADYFIISGVSEKPEQNLESKPLISSVQPITDVTVIFKGLGEQCPIGYNCIETTPGGHVADLNNGNFKSQNIQICYRRGIDKPPLVDIGVCYEDKDRVLPDSEIVRLTPYGRCASTSYSSLKLGTYITFRRAKTKNPYNQLVVVDLCVILNNKSEHPPRAFYCIKKNLNKSYYGMIGSEVFLCYKKSLLSPPSLSFTPRIISRFPLQDYANFPLPDTVPLFCLPAGANVELRPSNLTLPRPTTSTFVLTSDSAQKIYGSALSFYEPFEQSLLTEDQLTRLKGNEQESCESENHLVRETFSIKSICILSRWPFFECFEKFLLFLHKLVFNPNYSSYPGSPTHRSNVPLEHHISHFLLDVSFPTAQRSTVLVQLMPGTDETVTISQPSSRLPIPLTGASFITLLSSLGVENTMNVMLFGLCEQKILVHSLKPWVLTGVAEAITAMLFPFHWQCPYVPLCPLSLHGILNAPLPFIVGIDSRCFDTFTPPDDVICIDLDTKSIFLTELKKCLNPRILPKRATRVLRNSLEKIFKKLMRIEQAIGQSPQHQSPGLEASRQQISKALELEIQEAFVRFMATILSGFRSYLLPITKAPTVGTTDPTSLFNFEGFLSTRERNYSQFYQLITKTQMFTHYIEERSFVSDKDTSLAFFDDCEEKWTSSDNIFSDRPIKLFNITDSSIQTDRSVYIPAPEQSPSVGVNNSLIDFQNHQQQPAPQQYLRKRKFGPLNASLFHKHPQINNYPSLDKAFNAASTSFENHQLFNGNISIDVNKSFSISRRTKQEVKASQKMAKKCSDTPLDWSKYLVSCSYCLWFATLPSYIAYCKTLKRQTLEESNVNNSDAMTKLASRILRYAHSTIVRMQKFQLTTDEICFRILTLLCGHYGQPALAVRIFFEMKKAGIKPNAVTYGYYNKAVLESRWPDHSSKPTTVLWTKLRNVISGIALFKSHGRNAKEPRNERQISDPSFYGVDAVNDTTSCHNDLFKPTTLPIRRDLNDEHVGEVYSDRNHHRRSLISRSFSTHQKSTLDISDEKTIDSPNTTAVPSSKSSIHKSYSMHLRNGSQEQGSLTRLKSSSLDDDDDIELKLGQRVVNQTESILTSRKATPTHNYFLLLKERHQLLVDSDRDSKQSFTVSLDQIDSPAGLLFTTNPEICHKITRSASQSPIQLSYNIDTNSCSNNLLVNQTGNLLLEPDLVAQNHIADKNTFLKINSYGEDAQILRKIDSIEQRPNFADSVNEVGSSFTGQDDVSSEETKSNKLSESITEPSEGYPENEEELSMLKNITSTPNFKLASLINDASNLQWSNWTSSQNSKSVYKGIKNAATGIVSSLQEIKSSFSISNSATPSKLLTSAHHRSTATREMLSQWANYFSAQPSRGDDNDSDCSSVCSNDLLHFSNDEELEASTTEANDFRCCQKLFDTLAKHYNNSSSKEDLIDHSLGEKSDCQNKIALEVKLSTCSRCNICNSLLYDEEIMDRWSHNESNLNTKCVYCRAKIVPLMSISVEDYRFMQADEDLEQPRIENITEDLVDLNFDDSDTSEKQAAHQASNQARKKQPSQQNFTVPYLSPIVLRKELESVFESSGDNCPASTKFVDEHPIIYWNLLWYFSRINVPTHLAYLCLNSKSILDGREVPKKIDDNLDKVIVRILWDNDKLHAGIGKPLYRLIDRGNPSMYVQAILCDEIHFTRSFLERVIGLIKNNELHKAMNLVLNARLKSSNRFSFNKNRHNLYRDLIFLLNKELGPGKLHLDNFEREYKKSFGVLNFQQVAMNRFDRPPTIRSLFCRKFFKEPSLDGKNG